MSPRISTRNPTRSSTPIPTRIEASAQFEDLSPRAVASEFRTLLDEGARLHVVGDAKRKPKRLFELGYTPRHRVDLFGTRFYLTNVRQNPELRFCIAYVVQRKGRVDHVHARLFYKDLSLVWRAGSHFSRGDGSLWVGKGDVKPVVIDGEELVESVESTTDLPTELQPALEELLRRGPKPRRDEKVIELVLQRAPGDQIEPFEEFSEPRERARKDKRNLINGGRSIARFKRRNDPASLVFTKGFEPDFSKGVFEMHRAKSTLYHGNLRRYRILSKNRRVQYIFIAGPKHVWIIPPQPTTTELSSFGVRTIDVVADDDVFIPGYEYHFLDESVEPAVFHTQIPDGFAGRECPHDDAKADASPWIEKLPVIREFRRKVLKQRR